MDFQLFQGCKSRKKIEVGDEKVENFFQPFDHRSHKITTFANSFEPIEYNDKNHIK